MTRIILSGKFYRGEVGQKDGYSIIVMEMAGYFIKFYKILGKDAYVIRKYWLFANPVEVLYEGEWEEMIEKDYVQGR